MCHQAPCVSRLLKQSRCCTSADGFLVVQSAHSTNIQYVDGQSKKAGRLSFMKTHTHTNQRSSLGTSPASENRDGLCYCGFLHVCKRVCVGHCLNTLQYSCNFLQCNLSLFFPRPIFHCGGHLVTDSGIVASEGFPSHYKPNSKCTWYITVSLSSYTSFD